MLTISNQPHALCLSDFDYMYSLDCTQLGPVIISSNIDDNDDDDDDDGDDDDTSTSNNNIVIIVVAMRLIKAIL